MRTFPGFSQGSQRSRAAFPEAFFTELLPLIDDLAELQLTVYCFWALSHKEGQYRCLTDADFRHPALSAALCAAAPEQPLAESLAAALARALERGTLIQASVQMDEAGLAIYVLNTPLGRAALEQVQAGAWRPSGGAVEILPERPNLYALYEANIGALTPMIGDALKDAEKDFPSTWIEEAIREAAELNKRSWRYIASILKRWEREGRSRDAAGRSAQPNGNEYVSGPYADFIEH